MNDVIIDEWFDDKFFDIDVMDKSEPNSVAFSQIMDAYKESKEERTQNE